MQIRYALVAVVIGTCSFFLGAWAQDEPKGGAGAMPGPPAWAALIQEHTDMSKSCGTFTIDGDFWMMPGTDPMKFTGTSTRKMIMKGYFLQEDMDGMSMGQPFKGRLIQGYDTVGKEYVSIWMDDHSPYISISRGAKLGEEIHQKGHMRDMMSGKLKATRSVLQSDAMGQITYSSYDTPEKGNEHMTMKMTYKRATEKGDK